MSSRLLGAILLVAGIAGAGAASSHPLSPGLTADGRTVPILADREDPACEEDFDDLPELLAVDGWHVQVNSSGDPPFGGVLALNWNYGIDTYGFGSQSGRPGSYVAANHLSAGGAAPDGGGNTASTWLLTPRIDFQPGASLSFYTRSIWSTSGWPDRLYVRLCTADPCTDVGSGPDDTGDFGSPLLAINPNLVQAIDPTGENGYPIDWTRFDIEDLPESGSGRIAFQYHVTDVEDYFAGVGHNGTVAAIDSVALHGVDRCPLRHDKLFANAFEGAIDPLAITQNADTTQIVNDITPSCYQGPTSWLRRFDLAGQHGLSGAVHVAAVDFGIDVTRSNQNVGVRLHSIPRGAELRWENMTLVGSSVVAVGVDEDGTVKRAEVTGAIPDAGAEDLVVEVSAGPYGGDFFMGSNTAPQTGPSYIAFPVSQTCSIDVTDPVLDPTQPTDMSPYVPDTHLLMVVHLADTANGAPGVVQ